MKNRDADGIWWATTIISLILLIAVDGFLFVRCISGIFLSGLAIEYKLAMTLGYLSCGYGWNLMIAYQFLPKSRRFLRKIFPKRSL